MQPDHIWEGVLQPHIHEAEHEDPAIGVFLALLESDIKSGKHLVAMPDELAQAMLANLRHSVDPAEEFVGEVAL